MSDFGDKQEGYAKINALRAMIDVIHSYESWGYSNSVCYALTPRVGELLTTNQIAGEIVTPKRTIRIAMLWSIGTITVLYLLITSAYVHVGILKIV